MISAPVPTDMSMPSTIPLSTTSTVGSAAPTVAMGSPAPNNVVDNSVEHGQSTVTLESDLSTTLADESQPEIVLPIAGDDDDDEDGAACASAEVEDAENKKSWC